MFVPASPKIPGKKEKKSPCFVAVHMKTLNDMWVFDDHTVTAEFSEMPAKPDK